MNILDALLLILIVPITLDKCTPAWPVPKLGPAPAKTMLVRIAQLCTQFGIQDSV